MKKKNKLSIESEKVVDVISEAKSALTETTLFYGLIKSNETTERCKQNEQKAIIEGITIRLRKIGLSEEAIKKIDWSLDPGVVPSYKEWCKVNNLDFSKLNNMERFLSQKGQQA
jgi:hypothetical protein